MNKVYLSILILLYSIPALLLSCGKDPEIISNTIVEYDTIYVTEQDTLFLTITDTLTLTDFIQDTATTFILVRHAETTGIGSNPDLSATGLIRSEELRRVLSNVPLDAVYSTNFNRTMQTAQPTADDKSLSVINYNPSSLSPFVDNVLMDYYAGAVLVVGHSNTTPSLLNVLVGANIYADLPESAYDNLYVVTVFENGRSEVVHLKYGG
ncbi:MAG: 2,3-bisphosphoglycerate-dependent phosphoglycerate mutase [Saprospiraceae bacterium]|jgi:2,3-bisphosphoglycerate-dependent phosphoglycerate mutase